MNTPAALTASAEPHVASFYAALWLGALALAGNAASGPFPDELDQLAAEFFSRFRPYAKG